MVSRRGKRRSSKSKSHELRIPAFEPLNAEESRARSHLIEQVGNAFYVSGMALTRLKEERLYRNTHLSFERGGRCFASSLSNHAVDEFCQDVFGYGSDYAYLKIAAAKIYQNLLDNITPPSQEIPTNGRHPILPTRQRQLRPIVKAKLEADAQVEVWNRAIALADSKIPSSSIVTEAVNLYLAEDDTQFNPFTEGEVCRIVVRGNSKLKGKGGSWCIIEEVGDRFCVVNTWNNQLTVPVNNLESRDFDEQEYQAIEDVGVRMTKLHQTEKLDKAALWILEGLAKLDRPQLTPLEDKLLRVLEEEYGLVN